MPIINRIAEFQDEITAWRQDFHAHPELLYDLPRTSGKVAEYLKSFGCDDVVTGMGHTGVVALIHGQRTGSGKMIGLRADMDALPIVETVDRPHASKTRGLMHACGHDGHTAMLLGAAKYLSETRNFDGTAVLIFQPAEEGGAGAQAMLDDGLLSRFNVQEIYGMHNQPGLPVGHFATCKGPIMGASDQFSIHIEGMGGYAAHPHQTVDPVVIAAAIIQAIQSIAARNVNPLDGAVVSVTQMHAGDAFNVISPTATLHGTARALKLEVQDLIEERMATIVQSTAKAFGGQAVLDYTRSYPVLSNHSAPTDFAAQVARQIADPAHVNSQKIPMMGG